MARRGPLGAAGMGEWGGENRGEGGGEFSEFIGEEGGRLGEEVRDLRPPLIDRGGKMLSIDIFYSKNE